MKKYCSRVASLSYPEAILKPMISVDRQPHAYLHAALQLLRSAQFHLMPGWQNEYDQEFLCHLGIEQKVRAALHPGAARKRPLWTTPRSRGAASHDSRV